MPLSPNTFLYAAAGYCAVNAAVFTFAPQIAVTDSFGPEEAAKNRPVKVMTGARTADVVDVPPLSACTPSAPPSPSA